MCVCVVVVSACVSACEMKNEREEEGESEKIFEFEKWEKERTCLISR